MVASAAVYLRQVHAKRAKMKAKITLVIVLSSLLGCQQDNSALEAKVTKLGTQLTSLETELQKLKVDVLILKQPKNSVSIDIGSKEYQLVETNVGPLLVALRDVKPYLNGQKLTIALGNPWFTSYSGAEFKLTWAKTLEFGKPDFDYEEWKKTKQEKTVKITNTLSSGSWNPVEIVLTPATPDQLGYLNLEINLDQLSLRP